MTIIGAVISAPSRSSFTMSNRELHKADTNSDLLRLTIMLPQQAKLQDKQMVEPDGFEPTTPCLQSRCSPN